ncbi:hypothetical protein DSAG12_03288 [Promethearchaeum syntrophicum]|uniref:Copper resistance protein D n=1 Tax=Promethearchaeum syntrophicum TaxID=2594042 RepID=A0A5B9DEM8_9ARCH|nr:hypothetical protein [Candidatus Prometheoarchaeum syntrophicum]QEE17451.1 hypothetical protein DSAG12_03288 [Candidatus Prometheoarchaeum syntrophicum]
MAAPFVPIIITTLHNLFTALWIGGMLTLAFAVFPSIMKVFGKSKETKLSISTIKKRMSIFVYVSMVGLILTGLLMAKQSGQSTGFLTFGNPYTTILSIKHILYILMILLSIFRSLIIDKLDKLTPPVKEKLNMIILIINILVGIAVLFLSAYISFMPTV